MWSGLEPVGDLAKVIHDESSQRAKVQVSAAIYSTLTLIYTASIMSSCLIFDLNRSSTTLKCQVMPPASLQTADSCKKDGFWMLHGSELAARFMATGRRWYMRKLLDKQLLHRCP